MVNAAVNREIRLVLDVMQYDREEYWTLPENGRGDCEDKALEKRRRLAEMGLPRGAMRMALVFHRRLLTSHGVLTVETTAGTYVLDSATDEVQRWDQTPYNFEARERPDGRWTRFDQAQWTYQR
jgi:predicted transglutaminase-like cysteine proteinase